MANDNLHSEDPLEHSEDPLEKLPHEDPIEQATDDFATSEAEHVPGADQADVLEHDEGVTEDDVHAEHEAGHQTDDGVHGFTHDEEAVEVATPIEDEAAAAPLKNWYIIHAYSGFENKVAESLKTRAQAFGFDTRLGQILIPTEEVIELRNGKKVTSKRLLYRATYWSRWRWTMSSGMR